MPIKELFLPEALELVKKKQSRLVWIGVEPADYVAELLQLEPGTMSHLPPQEAMGMDKKKAESYKNCVFVCYHGNSSRYVAQMLSDRYNLEAGSLKGGVTAIVGEIF